MERDVIVTVDGKAVPLNDFVKELVGSTVAAMIGSLKKGEGAEIVVTVRNKK